MNPFLAEVTRAALVFVGLLERRAVQFAAAELERMLGRRLEENPVRSAYIITADADFEQHFGKKAKRRRKLYNGMIPCQIYMYF